MTRLKAWFNSRWPYYRRCMRPWCVRSFAWDHRCVKHMGDR